MDFYICLTSSSPEDGIFANTPNNFTVITPSLARLQGQWECALVELSLDCQFTPKRERLYMCCDFLEQGYINQRPVSYIRNIEIRGRYKKYMSEIYADARYVPLRPGWRNQINIQLLDDEMKPVEFGADTSLHCVLHFRRRWVP